MNLDASNPYAEIERLIREAGFFVAEPHSVDPFPRICPASKVRECGGYAGNSFWIAVLRGQWFIGAWGGSIYTTSTPESLGQFAVEWLTHKPNETSADFDDWIIQKFSFSRFGNDEFDRKLN